MQTKLKRHQQNKRVFFSLIILSLVTIGGFQNCSPNIQVTDESLSASILAEPQITGASPQPIAQAPVVTPPVPTNPFIPSNPGLTLLPIQGDWASIAFEDNILDPGAGDRDFNDAVYNYRIAEQYNSASQLVRIFIEVRLREKLSGNSHRLGLILNGDPSPFYDNINFQSKAAFKGEARAFISTSTNEVQEIASAQRENLTVFSSSTNRKGEVVRIKIEIVEPQLNPRGLAQAVDYKKYRFILNNLGSDRSGIDIAEINSTDEMLANSNGYPFGFMIPADWQPPNEGQLIDKAYPNFLLYRNWLSQQQSTPPTPDVFNWFVR